MCTLLCSLCAGCVMPMRAPTRTKGPGEVENKLDLSFIKAGSTGRQEVLEKLGWIDTGLKDERLFLGRWISSSWAVLWAAAGGYSAGAGAERHWDGRNLMVEFDEKGLVKESRVFPDSALVKELSAWVARVQDRPELSTKTEITVEHRHAWGGQQEAKIVLGSDVFEFHETGKGSHDFRIPPKQIAGLTFARRDTANPQNIHHTIHFKDKTKAGSKMTLRTDVPTLLALVKYVGQNRPD